MFSFLFILDILKNSLLTASHHRFFKNVLFIFCTSEFSCSFIPLSLEMILGMILIFLSLLKLFCDLFGPSIQENVPCVLEKNIYSSTIVRKVMYIHPVKFIFSTVLFSFCFLTDFLSGCSIHYRKWGTEVSYSYGIALNFSIQICQYYIYLGVPICLKLLYLPLN